MANYGNEQIFGNPLAPGWEDQNLVTIKAPNGQLWRVNRAAAEAFQGLMTDLTAEGYNPMSSGGFNYRDIRGSDRLSQHAYGNAIDINAAANAMGGHATDMPANIGDLAAKHGLEWGGNWKSRPDPMHFEWTGPQHGLGPAGMPITDPSAPLGTSNGVHGPAGGPAPTGLAGMFAGGQMPAAQGGDVMGQIASQFLQNHQLRQQQQEQANAAEQQRRAALFGGGGLGAMYG